MTPDRQDAERAGRALRGTGRKPGRSVARAAVTDNLTGLPNRLYFDVVFEVFFEMGSRGIIFTLAILEIEGLDGLRERAGPGATVDAVKTFGGMVGSHTRRMDVFARVGEARFVHLLMDANLQGGLIAMDRMKELLADWSESTGLRFSAGLAAWRPGMREPGELWKRAEMALERALDGDRGEVVLADG